MKKLAPLLLAIAIGAVSGLLGALWPREQPPTPAEEQASPPPLEFPLEENAVAAVANPAAPAARRASRLEVALFCERLPSAGQLTVRRFEQTTLGKKWSAPSRAILADPQGHLVVPLSAGIYLLTARVGACAALHHSVEVKEGQAQQAVELWAALGQALVGQVVDASNDRPVGGALLQVQQQLQLRSRREESSAADDAWTTVTDSLGRYRIEGLGKGTFVVRGSAEGFADATTRVSLEGGEGRGELRLEPAGFIEGRVTGATGAATVKALRDEGRTVFANADGTFRLAVGPGDHLLMGEDSSGATGLVRVNLAPKGTARGVELKLERGREIRGEARLGGAPASCARVWVRAESDPYELAGAPVSADGSFVIERVPLGRYWLFAECPDGEHGDLLGVEPGRDPVTVNLKQAAGLMGRVVDATGRPVAGAEVEVSQPQREPVSAVTDGEGRFELSRLLPAVVRVEVESGTRKAGQRSIQLLEGQAVTLDFTLVETGKIFGRVNGPREAQTVVNAWSQELNQGDRARATADGSYTLRVVPGRYRVFPFLPGYQGFAINKQVDVEAGREVRVDFTIPKVTGERAIGMEASTPGTIGASFDDGPGGVMLSWIIAGSPVDKAGLKQGDLLIALDGQPVQRSVDAFTRTRGEPGSPVRVSYRRGGADAEVVVTRAGPQGSDIFK